MANFKIFKFFPGHYVANNERLAQLNYIHFNPLKRIMIIGSNNHGFGKIRGTTKKVGANYSPVPVCVFRRDNRQLLWETKSKADGSYAFRNIAVGLECFVVAFDPNNQYNAVIQDKVIAK